MHKIYFTIQIICFLSARYARCLRLAGFCCRVGVAMQALNSDMRSVGGKVAAPLAYAGAVHPDSVRIEQRWSAQALGPLFVAGGGQPLITSHISPQPSQRVAVRGDSLQITGGGKFKCFVTGSLIQVSKPGNTSTGGGGLRSIIVGFSPESRRRLQIKLAQLCRDAKPIFVTLTYPGEFPLDAAEWKVHFSRFCKRLHRAWDTVGLCWRLEPQKRGAPHYHMLVFGVPVLVSEFRAWVAAAWYESVNSGDPLHLKYGCQCIQTDGRKHVNSYISKYIGKVQAAPTRVDASTGEVLALVDWSRVGRWWGVRYKENLPWSEIVGGEILSFGEASLLMRFLRRYLHGQGVRASAQMRGMSVFVGAPEQWFANLDGLLGGGGGGVGSFLALENRIGLN